MENEPDEISPLIVLTFWGGWGAGHVNKCVCVSDSCSRASNDSKLKALEVTSYYTYSSASFFT